MVYVLLFSLGLSLAALTSVSGWAGAMVWLVYLSGIAVIFLFFISVLPTPHMRAPTKGVLLLGGCVALSQAIPGPHLVTRAGYVLSPLILVGTGGLVVFLGGVLLIAILVCAGQRGVR